MARDDETALGLWARDVRLSPHARADLRGQTSLVAELFLDAAVDDLCGIAESIGMSVDDSSHTFSAGELGDGSPECHVAFARGDGAWRERMAAIIEWGRAHAPDGVDPRFFVERCLWVDGWTLARGSVKTPLWMRHEEHELADLAREMPGVEWLCGSG